MYRRVVSGKMGQFIKRAFDIVGGMPLYLDSEVALFEKKGNIDSVVKLANEMGLKVSVSDKYVLVEL